MTNYTINSIQIGDDTYNINDFDSLNVNGTITGNIVSAHGVVLADGNVNFKTLRLQDGSTGNIDCLGVFTESHSSLFEYIRNNDENIALLSISADSLSVKLSTTSGNLMPFVFSDNATNGGTLILNRNASSLTSTPSATLSISPTKLFTTNSYMLETNGITICSPSIKLHTSSNNGDVTFGWGDNNTVAMSCNKNLIISTTLTTLTNGTISLQGCNLSITSLSTTTPPKAGGSTYIYGEKDVTIAGYGDNPKITLSNTTGANGVMTIKGNVLNLDTTYIYQNNTPLNDIYARLTGANTFTQNNTFASKVVLSGSSGTKGIQFGSANYQITNIEAGSIILSLPKSVGGERPNAQITLKQPNFGSGTWHFYVGILGDESETVSFATNALSSTGFKISIRRQVDISSRTDLPTNVPYTLHWLAVKYY